MTELSSRKARLSGIRTAVYRFFDSNDELLYVGITHDIDKRWGTHERIQPWWLDVARREFVWYATRAEAELVEATAAAAEKPRYDRSGQRTTGGEVDQRLAMETERAMQAVSADIENGTYPIWRFLPSYGTLSRKYGIPVIGITRGLTRLAHRDKVLVYHQDQFAVSRVDCIPSRDAQRVGLLYFLASNAFGDSPFTLNDLVEVTGAARNTGYQHVRRWEKEGRADRVSRLSRVLVYRITRHPEPDPPEVLTIWARNDLSAMAEWLNLQLDTDAVAISDSEVEKSLLDRDRDIIAACMPDEYGVCNAGVRVLKVMARRYSDRQGCLPEWGIKGAAE